MKNAIFALLVVVTLLGCGKDNNPPKEDPKNPDLKLALVIENVEGSGAVLDAKNRDAELARAEMIVRFAK